MSFIDFKKKWEKVTAKESASYQSHFDDLCRALQIKPPLEADPKGEFFCFQKHVLKNAESVQPDQAKSSYERGFADVWRQGFFAWEYKGKDKDLDAAYKQLLRYRESLHNPPLLVVCDYERYIVRTNFNGTVQQTFEFTNSNIDHPDSQRILRALFENPDLLKPSRTTAQMTEALASQIAEVARSLQKRESAELVDATTRKQSNFNQKRSLRIARFLNRLIFCMFAEDSGLLPRNLLSEILEAATENSKQLAKTLEELFRTMAKGGTYGPHKIRHFNGHLFQDTTVFELNENEIETLKQASAAHWQDIQPSIMGTLFERALEPEQRSQLGAHYTGEGDIRTLVEPVLMYPLRKEWEHLQATFNLREGGSAKNELIAIKKFQKKLCSTTVLDPACGSGNFLYVSLQLLLDLEKEVVNFAAQFGLGLELRVRVKQLKAIEINPYAYELAQVSVQIGYLQWRKNNGFDNDKNPILEVLDGFENIDALLNETFRKSPKSLKSARKDQLQFQESIFKSYVERVWPDCEVIVGNPPFLGDKLMRGELGDQYVEQLRRIYGDRIPGQSDFCCYWFEKARQHIERGISKRAGLLATQGIRGGANRVVLNRIKETGNIFFAVSDQEWILNGATVHVSLIGFDDGTEKVRVIDGSQVDTIHSNLSSGVDTTKASGLSCNQGIAFIGTTKGGNFDITEAEAIELLSSSGNPNGMWNSDVLKPIINGRDALQRKPQRWLIDNSDRGLDLASLYEAPHAMVVDRVKPERDTNRDQWLRTNWWKLQRIRPEMREALANVKRFIALPRVSKHRICIWFEWPMVSDDQTVVFARDDDYFFGIMQAKPHELWAYATGTQVRERESGFRYKTSSCFETYPFPERDEELDKRIGSAAQELNSLREKWLNPKEWTTETVLEFPASITGPWSKYIEPSSIKSGSDWGVARYRSIGAKDESSAAMLKKRTLTNLYNEWPNWLEIAHTKLDHAVLEAYGWKSEISDDEIISNLVALNDVLANREKNLASEKNLKLF